MAQQPRRQISPEAVWRRIETNAGQVFRQIRGQHFTYTVSGGAIRPSTTNWSVSRAHIARALDRVPLRNTRQVQDLMGPSYIYAILMDDRIRAGDW